MSFISSKFQFPQVCSLAQADLNTGRLSAHGLPNRPRHPAALGGRVTSASSLSLLLSRLRSPEAPRSAFGPGPARRWNSPEWHTNLPTQPSNWVPQVLSLWSQPYWVFLTMERIRSYRFGNGQRRVWTLPAHHPYKPGHLPSWHKVPVCALEPPTPLHLKSPGALPVLQHRQLHRRFSAILQMNVKLTILSSVESLVCYITRL